MELLMKSQLTATLIVLANFLYCTAAANASGEAEYDSSSPIELIYGYRYDESSITAHLEQFLWAHHNIAAKIVYSDSMRTPHNPFLTDRDLFQLDVAAELCSVHAVSLPSASPATIESYGGRSHFLPIASSSVSTYAPNYYRAILSNVINSMISSDSADPYYALPGYNYLNEKSVFLLAANISALSALVVRQSLSFG